MWCFCAQKESHTHDSSRQTALVIWRGSIFINLIKVEQHRKTTKNAQTKMILFFSLLNVKMELNCATSKKSSNIFVIRFPSIHRKFWLKRNFLWIRIHSNKSFPFVLWQILRCCPLAKFKQFQLNWKQNSKVTKKQNWWKLQLTEIVTFTLHNSIASNFSLNTLKRKKKKERTQHVWFQAMMPRYIAYIIFFVYLYCMYVYTPSLSSMYFFRLYKLTFHKRQAFGCTPHKNVFALFLFFSGFSIFGRIQYAHHAQTLVWTVLSGHAYIQSDEIISNIFFVYIIYHLYRKIVGKLIPNYQFVAGMLYVHWSTYILNSEMPKMLAHRHHIDTSHGIECGFWCLFLFLSSFVGVRMSFFGDYVTRAVRSRYNHLLTFTTHS